MNTPEDDVLLALVVEGGALDSEITTVMNFCREKNAMNVAVALAELNKMRGLAMMTLATSPTSPTQRVEQPMSSKVPDASRTPVPPVAAKPAAPAVKIPMSEFRLGCQALADVLRAEWNAAHPNAAHDARQRLENKLLKQVEAACLRK